MALTKHRSIDYLAEHWGYSRRTVIWIVDQYLLAHPNIHLPSPGKTRSRHGPIKRPYLTRSIPDRIAQDVYHDLCDGKISSRPFSKKTKSVKAISPELKAG
jgi:hypothetical protein